MTSFETEIYNRETDNVIGARVIVSADNGQTIDSIQVTNKTQFDELKGRLDTLNEDYTQFDEDSDLAGLTIDEILTNTNEVAKINATTLNGFKSDRFAKSSHTHLKKSITDLYNYDITASNYNMNLGSSANVDKQSTISVKVTNMNNSPVANHQIILYKNGVLWRTGNTNNNGVFSAVYTAEIEGIVTFQVNNQKVQCNVKYETEWKDFPIDVYQAEVINNYSDVYKLQYRRIGKTVYLRGILKMLQSIDVSSDHGPLYVGRLGPAFRPSRQERRRGQAVTVNTHYFYMDTDGKFYAGGRYGTTSMANTLNKNTYFDCYMSYSVD